MNDIENELIDIKNQTKLIFDKINNEKLSKNDLIKLCNDLIDLIQNEPNKYSEALQKIDNIIIKNENYIFAISLLNICLIFLTIPTFPIITPIIVLLYFIGLYINSKSLNKNIELKRISLSQLNNEILDLQDLTSDILNNKLNKENNNDHNNIDNLMINEHKNTSDRILKTQRERIYMKEKYSVIKKALEAIKNAEDNNDIEKDLEISNIDKKKLEKKLINDKEIINKARDLENGNK